MRNIRVFCIFILCMVLAGVLPVNTSAICMKETGYDVAARATGQFSTSIPKNSSFTADTSFPMNAGETVRINASYTPNGSVDFGLIDSNGIFYCLNVTNGSINKTITIEESGNYTLAIRNNSAQTIKVSGFVRY